MALRNLRKEIEPKTETEDAKEIVHEKGEVEPVLIPLSDDTLKTGWKVWFSEKESEITNDPFLAKLGSVILKNI